MITTDDLREATDLATQTLSPHTGNDWSVKAGTLDWSCRDTLDHIISALMFYAGQIGTRATSRRRRIRAGDPEARPEDLLEVLGTAAAVLSGSIDTMRPSERAYHPAGMSDASGFAAMAVDEVLVHTWDIASGLGIRFGPDTPLVPRLVERLYPWAGFDPDPWAMLLWCNGRVRLGGREQLGADWSWWSRPLAEWDGAIHRRTTPPPTTP
ncbi:MAG: maleylpyruvate isomerase N-terminal domain-containing protein [Acidimicrobiia bacterium]|nr:maleylpyruvate isomerase N-terminal domain-containing protein [Acidimicrobiia bacterium]MDH4306575.1 maleylpyruvate isomerase N-terminal domain-containing protein [Acidimicrobiia bacterium]MDH5294275.1 maleylpyruvate isomerase N-terminal domain-containing protein [Acidimicrobiia bacterium]